MTDQPDDITSILDTADLVQREARDEIIRLREQTTWLTIESAPTDGTWVLLCWPMTRTNVIVSGHYYTARDGEGMWASLPMVQTKNEPTHWMPLPHPPKESKP